MSEPREPSVDTFQNELEDYELIQFLGRGQSTVVFHAKNKAFDLDVSLKILESQDADFEERFIREFRLLYTFNHPNIAPVRDCGRTRSGRYFFTTNYLGGETISTWLEQRGPFEVGTACRIMLQLLSALEYCHSHEVLHRDINPKNVILIETTEDPVAVLGDLGLAKLFKDPIQEKSLRSITATGMKAGGRGLRDSGIGKPQYMAPELAWQEATVQSDLYALTITFLEMLAGLIDWSAFSQESMWVDKSPNFFLGTILQGSAAQVDAGLRAILEQGLRTSPRKRFPSIGDYMAAIENYLNQSTGPEPSNSFFTRFFRQPPSAS